MDQLVPLVIDDSSDEDESKQVVGGVKNDDDMLSESNRVLVCCRVRPALEGEIAHHVNLRPAVCVERNNVIVWLPPSSKLSRTPEKAKRKSFVMDRVFDEYSTQAQVHEDVMLPLVHSVLSGINSCLIAYGQTGAGKTFTTFGPLIPENNTEISNNPKFVNLGLIPRAVQTLFEELDAKVKNSRIGSRSTGRFSYAVHVSYYQIYLDSHIQDLLNPERSNLTIKRQENIDGSWSHQVDGLSVHRVTCLTQVLTLLARGDRSKVVAQTAMNSKSSRSHSVFTIQLTQHEGKRNIGLKSLDSDDSDWGIGVGHTIKAKLTCVDLAGSERASKTHPEGIQLEEAKSINRSLSALGNVIAALGNSNSTSGAVSDSGSTKTESENFVPWRDSKLTKLLQDSLDGRSRVSLIINIGPAASNVNESINSLLFGRRSMSVILQPTANIIPDDKYLAQHLALVLEKSQASFEERIENLQKKLSIKQKEVDKLKKWARQADSNIGLIDQIANLKHDLHVKSTELANLQETHVLLEEALLEQLQKNHEEKNTIEVVDATIQCELDNMKESYEDTISTLSEKNIILQKKLDQEMQLKDEALVELEISKERVDLSSKMLDRKVEQYERRLMLLHDRQSVYLLAEADKRAFEALRDENRKLKVSIKEQQESIMALKAKAKSYHAEKKTMSKNLQSTSQEYDRLSTETQEQLIMFQNHIKKLQDEKKDMENELVSIENENNSLLLRIRNADGKEERFNELIEEAESKLQQSYEDRRVLLQRYKELEDKSRSEISQLQTLVETNLFELAEYKRKFANTELHVQGKLDELVQKDAIIEDLKISLIDERKRFDEDKLKLTEKNVEMNDRFSQMEQRLDLAEQKLHAMIQLREQEKAIYDKLLGGRQPKRNLVASNFGPDMSSPRVKNALQRSRLALDRAIDAFSDASNEF